MRTTLKTCHFNRVPAVLFRKANGEYALYLYDVRDNHTAHCVRNALNESGAALDLTEAMLKEGIENDTKESPYTLDPRTLVNVRENDGCKVFGVAFYNRATQGYYAWVFNSERSYEEGYARLSSMKHISVVNCSCVAKVG